MESKNQDLIKFAYENLSKVPHCDAYERMISGMFYNPGDPLLADARIINHDFADDYGAIRVKDFESIEVYSNHRRRHIAQLFGKVGRGVFIEAPFRVDYGYNVCVGDDFYANYNLVLLDCSIIKIGNGVICGPNVTLTTATHPTGIEERKQAKEYALPITIGDNVWLSCNVVVLPGVTIGENSVIGAGAVVSKDIPPNSVAVGVPAKVIKTLEEN